MTHHSQLLAPTGNHTYHYYINVTVLLLFLTLSPLLHSNPMKKGTKPYSNFLPTPGSSFKPNTEWTLEKYLQNR